MTDFKPFYDAVRSGPFPGKLTGGQVLGMQAVLDYAIEYGYSRKFTAYALATDFHETGAWMQPIREGAHRVGPGMTDAASRRAVTTAVAKGLINKNYALPAGPYGLSYYGRGLAQITHLENYQKFEKILKQPLVRQPDLALNMPVALDILFLGMRDGLFTGVKMTEEISFYDARSIINGDKKKNGKLVADQAEQFFAALEGVM